MSRLIIFLSILIGLLVLLSLLLFVPSQIGIEYQTTDKQQDMKLFVRILGIPLRFQIPIAKDEKEIKQDAERDTKKLFAHMTFEKFKFIVSGVKEAYDESKDNIKVLLRYLRKHIRAHTIYFHINFGLSDPAKTGIATGAVWTLGTNLLAVIDQLITIRHIDMNVLPDFQHECFNLHIKSILSLRLVHIINVSIKLLKIVNLFINKTDMDKNSTKQGTK